MITSGTECEKCQAGLSLVVEKVVVGSNCHECGRYRFESTQPSYLYFLTHPGLGLHTIGIGTIGKDKNRLQILLKNGWIAYGIWHGDQRTTFLWEKKIFSEFKKIIHTRLPRELSSQENWTKTWPESISADSIAASEIVKIISQVVENIGKK